MGRDVMLHRVIPEGGRRQTVVACPSCTSPTALWLRVQTAAEFREQTGAVDVTASLLPPGHRSAAMRQAAEIAARDVVSPWVQCGCGYDGLYQFGGGMP